MMFFLVFQGIEMTRKFNCRVE
uniref:Uncharacterized protein n=1 Tax=Arundo donax TaxID=35708 RepID=A0A0A9G2D4_ARUDO